MREIKELEESSVKMWQEIHRARGTGLREVRYKVVGPGLRKHGVMWE